MHHFDLGGDALIRQFVFGFPTTGFLSQSGVFQVPNKAKPPLPDASIWNSSVKRIRERARASGYRNADAMWGTPSPGAGGMAKPTGRILA